jgi:hypothetical protein
MFHQVIIQGYQQLGSAQAAPNMSRLSIKDHPDDLLPDKAAF